MVMHATGGCVEASTHEGHEVRRAYACSMHRIILGCRILLNGLDRTSGLIQTPSIQPISASHEHEPIKLQNERTRGSARHLRTRGSACLIRTVHSPAINDSEAGGVSDGVSGV